MAQTSPKYHRPYLLTALAFAFLGLTLGVAMLGSLSGWLPNRAWTIHLEAHAEMQVYGFVVIFTMGIAHQMFHQIFGKLKGKKAMHLSLLCMTLGTLWAAFRGLAKLPVWPGPTLQALAAAIFLYTMMAGRPANGKKLTTPVHAFYLRSACLWLLVALGLRIAGHSAALPLNLTLWGFVSLYILGAGLRIHPGFLVVPGEPTRQPAVAPQWWILVLWQIGLGGLVFPQWRQLTDVAWLAAALMVHWQLRPLSHFRPWLRGYLGLSYFWLLGATAGRVAQAWGWSGMGVEGAVRHTLASGFILTMIMGMAFRLVPVFEGKELRWPRAPWVCLSLLTICTPLRLAGEACLGQATWPIYVAPAAGLGQALAALIFVAAMADTLLTAPRQPGTTPIPQVSQIL